MTLKTLNKKATAYLERHDERLDSRPPVCYSDLSMFNLPTQVLEGDPGHKYSWIPIEVNGRRLQNEYDHACFQRKFKPVLSSELPTLARRYEHDPFGRTTETELIIRGNELLMKRTLEDHEEEVARYDESRARHNYIRDMHSMSAHNVRMLVDDRLKAYK